MSLTTTATNDPTSITSTFTSVTSSPSSSSTSQGPVNNSKRLIVIIVVCVGGFILVLVLVLLIVPFARRRLERKRRSRNSLANGDGAEKEGSGSDAEAGLMTRESVGSANGNGFSTGSVHERRRSGPDASPLLGGDGDVRDSLGDEGGTSGNENGNEDATTPGRNGPRIGGKIKVFNDDELNNSARNSPRRPSNLDIGSAKGTNKILAVDEFVGEPSTPSPRAPRFGDVSAPRPMRALKPPPVIHRSNRTRMSTTNNPNGGGANAPMSTLPEDHTIHDITPAIPRSPSPTTTHTASESADAHAHLTSPTSTSSSSRDHDPSNGTWLHIPNLPPARRLISAFQSSLSSISSAASSQDSQRREKREREGSLPPMKHYPSITTNSHRSNTNTSVRSPTTSFYSMSSGSVGGGSSVAGSGMKEPASSKRDTFGIKKSRGGGVAGSARTGAKVASGDGTFGSRDKDRSRPATAGSSNLSRPGTGQGTTSSGHATESTSGSGYGSHRITLQAPSSHSSSPQRVVTELGELRPPQVPPSNLNPNSNSPTARLRSQMPSGKAEVKEASEIGFLLPPSRQASFLSGQASATSLGSRAGTGTGGRSAGARSTTTGSGSVYSDAREDGFSDV